MDVFGSLPPDHTGWHGISTSSECWAHGLGEDPCERGGTWEFAWGGVCHDGFPEISLLGLGALCEILSTPEVAVWLGAGASQGRKEKRFKLRGVVLLNCKWGVSLE